MSTPVYDTTSWGKDTSVKQSLPKIIGCLDYLKQAVEDVGTGGGGTMVEIDGGSPGSTYLATQVIDGGGPGSTY